MKKGDVIYWTPFDDGAADRARAFCKSRGLTPNDVKIVKRDGMVLVEVIRDGAKCKV